jgi:transposase
MLRSSSNGYTVDRDVNAAKDILVRAMRFGTVGLAGEAMVAEPAPVQQSEKSTRKSTSQPCADNLTDP